MKKKNKQTLFEEWFSNLQKVSKTINKRKLNDWEGNIANLAWSNCKQHLLEIIEKQYSFPMSDDECSNEYLDKDKLIGIIREKL